MTILLATRGGSKCREPRQPIHQTARLASRTIAMAFGMEVAAAPTRVSTMVTMSTRTYESFKPSLPQDWTTGGLIGGWINATLELLIAIGLVLFVVGAPFLFIAGTIYLYSQVGSDLPNLGQFYGP